MEQQRLDKLIANTGRYSRKEARELIRRGRVRVNGAPAKSGDDKVGYDDEVTVEGVAIRNQEHLYIMLNKPAGVVCATRDRACPTVLDLLPPGLRREGLFPAGRLDKDTEGFVLITDDGDFAHRILTPKNHVPKTYHARLAAPVDAAGCAEMARAFAAGMELDGGDQCSSAGLRVLEYGEQPLVEVVIHEGMYHQVKRMFRRVSHRVVWLKRVKIGGIPLDPALAPGEAREMLHKEIGGI